MDEVIDSFTETTITNESWGSRMKDSFGSVCCGITLFLASWVVLFWNEGRAVKRQKDLDEGIKAVIDIDNDPLLFSKESGALADIFTKYDDKLVYVNGMTRLTNNDSDDNQLFDELFNLNVTADGSNGITYTSQIDQQTYVKDVFRYTRNVEMYQWIQNEETKTRKEKTSNGGTRTITETTYSYYRDWSSTLIDSTQFKKPSENRTNPTRMLVTEDFQRVNYDDITLDLIFDLSADITSQIYWETSWNNIPNLNINTITNNIRSELGGVTTMPSTTTPDGTSSSTTNLGTNETSSTSSSTSNNVATDITVSSPDILNGRTISIENSNSMIYIGNSTSSPVVGDTRITFSTLVADDISLVALLMKDNDNDQTGSDQTGGTLEPYITKGGRDLLLFSRGIVTSDELFETAYAANTTTTWILRFVGWLMMFIGISSVFMPLVVFVDIIPLIGDVMEAGLENFIVPMISCCISCPCTLLVISIGWIFYRPVFAIISILVMGGILYLMYTLVNNRKKPTSQGGGGGGASNGGGKLPAGETDEEIAVGGTGGNATPYVSNKGADDGKPTGDFANALDG